MAQSPRRATLHGASTPRGTPLVQSHAVRTLQQNWQPSQLDQRGAQCTGRFSMAITRPAASAHTNSRGSPSARVCRRPPRCIGQRSWGCVVPSEASCTTSRVQKSANLMAPQMAPTHHRSVSYLHKSQWYHLKLRPRAGRRASPSGGDCSMLRCA